MTKCLKSRACGTFCLVLFANGNSKNIPANRHTTNWRIGKIRLQKGIFLSVICPLQRPSLRGRLLRVMECYNLAMYKIYVVEDDKGIADGISQCLSAWEMEVAVVSDFRNVLGEIKELDPHLIIMDITLPYMGGYHWCQEIRKTSNVPIIFISSATDNMNIVMAMNMGADDYIPKPFDQSVLIAKVQALLRRTYDFNQGSFTLQAKGAVLNMNDNSLTYEGKKIELARNEYKILLTLMENKNKVVSREKLMEVLWETDSFVDENTLTVNVGRLRKTLEAAGLTDFIKTKFGVGYILEDE